MIVVLNENDYEIGKSHYVENSILYTLVDTETGKRKEIKGSSLNARLRKEAQSKNYTIGNVNYSPKKIYWDVALESLGYIIVDPYSGKLDTNVDNVSIIALKSPKGKEKELGGSCYSCYISISGCCLDFNIRKKHVYINEDETEISALNGNIQYSMLSDRRLTAVKLGSIRVLNNVIDAELQILSDGGISYSAKVIIDVSSYSCSINNSIVFPLPDAISLAQSNIFGGVATKGELEFKRESILSNFFVCPVQFDGRLYSSSEAAYQSMKTLDSCIRDSFVSLTPEEAKWKGRQIEESPQLRQDWASVKRSVMYSVIKAKFSQNKNCYSELIKTRGKVLVENTTGWHDTIWGRCACNKCSGFGQNWLGYDLTELRKEFIGE